MKSMKMMHIGARHVETHQSWDMAAYMPNKNVLNICSSNCTALLEADVGVG